ncbi:hypothetical protein KHQ81_06355 [Mycoplasmatota bacterium]|nr:hypothetical protein KHQ81_06355 [Mycoplasmatota bacterium]
MAKQKYYPTKKYKNNRSNNSIARPVAATNRGRYKKGYQNNLTNATRRTETYSKDKVVIVTESVNVVDFNNDNFTYKFDNIHQRTNKHYNKRRKK